MQCKMNARKDVKRLVANARETLLPIKSKFQYEITYAAYNKWCICKKIAEVLQLILTLTTSNSSNLNYVLGH